MWSSTILVALTSFGGFLWCFSVLRPPLFQTSDAPLSSSTYTCTGNDTRSGRCIFRNALVRNGTITLFGLHPNVTLPPLLCSISINPQYSVLCSIHLVAHQPPSVLTKNTSCHLDIGVSRHRLNPTNPYHIQFEDVIPFWGVLHSKLGLSDDPRTALVRLNQSRVGFFVMDHVGPHLDSQFWLTLLPEISVIHPRDDKACWVNTLFVGSRAECTHWWHCNSSYNPPDSGLRLREVVLHRMSRNALWLSTIRPARGTTPRITLVKRVAGSRQFANILEIQTTLKTFDPNLHTVDLATLTVSQQIAVGQGTDIYVLVHGGALGNLLWLSPNALVVDIWPYPLPDVLQGFLIPSIRGSALPWLNLGHHPLELVSSKGHQLMDGQAIRQGCECGGQNMGMCMLHMFGGTKLVNVDTGRLHEHMHVSVGLWRSRNYTPPILIGDWIKKGEPWSAKRAGPIKTQCWNPDI